MKRILSDEIFFVAFLGLVWGGAFFYFGKQNIILYVLISSTLTVLLFFVFLFFKIFTPQLLISEGKYEECIKHCIRELDGKYSFMKFVGAGKILNYYRINKAYAYMRMDESRSVASALEEVAQERVLRHQIFIFQVLKAYTLIDSHRFREALDNLLLIRTENLSQKYLPEIFYYISLCYLELKLENSRALNYAKAALALKNHSSDFKLNYAVSIYICENNAIDSLTLLKEIYSNPGALSVFSKKRLLYYLSLLSDKLGDRENSLRFESTLKNQFPDSLYIDSRAH